MLADFDIELAAVLGMVDPTPLERQMLARVKFRQNPNHGREPITAQIRDAAGAVRAQAQNSVAVFGVVVGQAFE